MHTQGEYQEAVLLVVCRIVECANVLGGETWCIRIVVIAVRPIELVVEAVSGVHRSPLPTH